MSSVYPLLHRQAERMNLGHFTEVYGAFLLRRHGLHVHLSPCRVRTEAERPETFSDEVDIVAFAEEGGPEAHVEVKGRDIDFTDDPSSWPFPDVLLYREGKGMKPDAVLIISNQTGAALGVIPNGDRKSRPQVDKKRGYVTPTVVAPPSSLMTIGAFAEALRGRLAPTGRP